MTIEEIQVDEKWGWLEDKPFPKLNNLTKNEIPLIKIKFTNVKKIAVFIYHMTSI